MDRGASVFIQSYILTTEFAKHAISLVNQMEADHCHFYQQTGSKSEEKYTENALLVYLPDNFPLHFKILIFWFNTPLV